MAFLTTYIEKCVGYDPMHFCTYLGFGNGLLLAERQRLVLDPVDQYKENVGTQAHSNDVDWCVDVPTKPLGELLEHDDRRITRSHEEHIHAFSQTELDEAV